MTRLPTLPSWAAVLLFAVVLPACATASAAETPEGPTGDAALLALDERGRAALEASPPPGTERFAIAGAVVLTAEGTRFEPGHVVVADGRIVAVGEGAAPTGSGPVIDAKGAFLTPGLIDTHSHMGVYPKPSAGAHSDGNEATAPTTPGVWAEHSFWPQDPAIALAIRGGVTTIQALPGSANLIGGRGVTLHLRPTLGSRAMRLPDAPETLKMACGENPKRVYGKKGRAPATRMGNIRGQRQAFAAAAQYRRDQAEKTADTAKRDLDAESLVGLLEGRILAQVHCYRADDMLSFMQMADEFGFEIRSFHHALEAYKIRDVLAKRDVAINTWADWWGFKMEAYDGIPENTALMTDAGGRAVIHSDSSEGIQRLNQEAAKAYHAGLAGGISLTEDQALRWITANPAWVLGVGDQVGSIAAGKRADLVLWDKHPFSVYARASHVWIDGVKVYDAAHPTDPPSDFLLGQEVGR